MSTEIELEPSVEMEVAARLLEGLAEQLGPAVERVLGIEVAVGDRHGLDVAALAAALEQLLPGREIRISALAELYKCADCGAEFPADEHPCPVCGSIRVGLLHGDELGITRAWA